ncbi:MAG: LL-diaminopimelate aminotransferase [Candidatus Pacebacteria bacterium]|nr:LL-diaminopimelate aminotransferase [Candidatus Paceibacterota bacterium]
MKAKRIKELPPYLFARIEKKIAEKKEQGVDIISLGIGDPDRPTPKIIIDKLAETAQNPANHQYPSSAGMLSFRKAVTEYYKKRHNVQLDPKTEVVSLIGSKEGIGHISLCYVDPGDINLVPEPGYPVYGIGTLLAGGTSFTMPLMEENNFLPDLEKIPSEVADKAKLMFINYPNNPTGAVADINFFNKVVSFAKKHNIIVCHDAAYTEVYYDDQDKPISFLEAEGALDVGIEFGSLSKPFNMTGWRIGYAAGRKDVIEALTTIKSNIDSGVFQAVQEAAITGLENAESLIRENQIVYKERRDEAIASLKELGWEIEAPRGSFYIWAKVPKGYDSSTFAEEILEKTGVIITPGLGYGQAGEGYFRISLTVDQKRMKEAFERIKKEFGKFEF